MMLDEPLVLAVLTLIVAQPPSPPSPGVDPMTLGPGIGQAIPAFRVNDQDGRPRDLASLRGPKGLVLVFFRSADW